MREGRERLQELQNDESSDSSITVLLDLGSPATNAIESNGDQLLDLRDDESNGSSDTIPLDLQDPPPAANENGDRTVDYRRLRTQYPRYNPDTRGDCPPLVHNTQFIHQVRTITTGDFARMSESETPLINNVVLSEQEKSNLWDTSSWTEKI